MARAFGAQGQPNFSQGFIAGLVALYRRGNTRRLGRASVYIVVAEQYGAAMGLGYLSSVAAQRFQMAAMFVPIIIIA